MYRRLLLASCAVIGVCLFKRILCILSTLSHLTESSPAHTIFDCQTTSAYAYPLNRLSCMLAEYKYKREYVYLFSASIVYGSNTSPKHP